MKHKVYAVRTKTDKKEVLVSDSEVPVDMERLKVFVLQDSLEFDETSRFRTHTNTE
jgi:hypothetical protein